MSLSILMNLTAIKRQLLEIEGRSSEATVLGGLYLKI